MGVSRAAGLAPSGSLKPGTEVANRRLTLPRRRRGSGLVTAQAVAVGAGWGPRGRAQLGSPLFSSPNTQPRCLWGWAAACRPRTLISLWFPDARKQGWGPSREVRVPCALAFTSQKRRFPDGSAVMNLPALQGTRVQPLGREDPQEEEMATPPQCSCLEKSMDRGAWQAAIHGVAQESDD